MIAERTANARDHQVHKCESQGLKMNVIKTRLPKMALSYIEGYMNLKHLQGITTNSSNER